MPPLPCLCSWPDTFGQKLVFALLTDEGICPVRGIPINRVRSLFGPKPPQLPERFAIHLLGRECEEFLDEVGMLEGLLKAMAQDLYQARKRNPSSKKAKAEWAVHLTEIGKFQP